MDAQTIFTQSVTHIREQGKPARTKNPVGVVRCHYRWDNTLSCAVGCLMTDEEAEDADSNSTSSVDQIPLPERLQPHVELLAQLQRAHDQASDENFLGDFNHAIENIARARNLEVPK